MATQIRYSLPFYFWTTKIIWWSIFQKLESPPPNPNCSDPSRLSPPARSMIPWSPPNYFWNHSLNGLKWSHLTDMGCKAIEMVPHISLSSLGHTCGNMSHVRFWNCCQIPDERISSWKSKYIKAQIASDHWRNLAPLCCRPWEGAMGN